MSVTVNGEEFDLDLGDGHYLKFTHWAPDDLPQNRKLFNIPDGEPMPVVERWGAMVRHVCAKTGKPCLGSVKFDGEWQRRTHAIYEASCKEQGIEPLPYVSWQVSNWEPLTLTPSLLCKAPLDATFKEVCNDHGYITNGLWVRA